MALTIRHNGCRILTSIEGAPAHTLDVCRLGGHGARILVSGLYLATVKPGERSLGAYMVSSPIWKSQLLRQTPSETWLLFT